MWNITNKERWEKGIEKVLQRDKLKKPKIEFCGGLITAENWEIDENMPINKNEIKSEIKSIFYQGLRLWNDRL